MKTMKASEFNARCLASPVAELRAPGRRRATSPIGLHRGRVRISGSIMAPLGAKWDALT